MPLFGAHMSVAGGIHLALERMKSAGCDSLQIFTKNQRRWDAPPLSDSDSSLFRQKRLEYGNPPVASHGSYLVNPAATDDATAANSIDNMADELRRCAKLGVDRLVIHSGAHGGTGPEEGAVKAAKRIDAAIEASGVESVRILLENTAGQGSWLGSNFRELKNIIEASKHSTLLGVCLDTCHAFGAGYDFRTVDGYGALFGEIEREVGLDRLLWFHLNDSLAPLGSHRDRHTHIGEGELGLGAFRLLVNDPRFAAHPMALETPKEDDLVDDVRNLKTLRGLLAEGVKEEK